MSSGKTLQPWAGSVAWAEHNVVLQGAQQAVHTAHHVWQVKHNCKALGKQGAINRDQLHLSDLARRDTPLPHNTMLQQERLLLSNLPCTRRVAGAERGAVLQASMC